MSGKPAVSVKWCPIVALTHETFVAALLLIIGGVWLALVLQTKPDRVNSE